MKRIFYIALLLAGCFSACKKDTAPAPDLGYEYYPVQAGSWVIYDVDSTYYNLFTKQKEEFSFQLKELVDSVFPDNAGRSMMRIKRFYRNTSNDEWKVKRVWSAVRTTDRVERTEENVKIIKLIFPVRRGKSWDGNAMNTLGEMIYKYSTAHESATIGSTTFDSTATILQEADSNLIEKKFKQEIYAKNVGLIYKAYIDVAVQDTVIDFTKPFDERINTGVKYFYRINSFGK